MRSPTLRKFPTEFCVILRYRAEFFPGKKSTMVFKTVEEVPAEVPVDDFEVLEEKVFRTIEMYKAARESKLAAERDVQRLRAQLEESEEQVDTLKREVVQLRRDREEVRGRVEKMLRQIDAISEEKAVS